MGQRMDEDFLFQVYAIVEEIPEGCVATYGLVARLAGREGNARLVGKALRVSGLYGEYPCHRVVNAQGRLAPGWEEQRALLQRECVSFRPNGCVDVKKHLWEV